MRRVRALLLHATSAQNATLSYQRGWPRHFLSHPGFECLALNVLGPRLGRLAAPWQVRRAQVDAIVVLHSVFSNANHLAGRLFDAVAAHPAPKAYFLGNEYKLMPEKLAFCAGLGVRLLVTQTREPRVHELYRERLGCTVIGLPNTGLDRELFAPRTPRAQRPIELGYRALDAPLYLGHDERRRLAEAFREAAVRHRLKVDISLDPKDRLEEEGWARFLDSCQGQLGSEAGGDYFELTDATRSAVNAFQAEHPEAGLPEVFERFFRDYPDPVPMRILSGRNVEAAGTRTVQLLMEGRYDGYFQPGVHYIPLRRDLGNVDEALATFRDPVVAERIAGQAYEVAVSELTYPRLIDRFHAALVPLL
jgi:hypothetical protein